MNDEELDHDKLVVLDHDSWPSVVGLLSPLARVVQIQMPLMPVAYRVDLPVSGFVWPTPADQVSVGVYEPDMDGFMERIQRAGIDSADQTNVDDMVPATSDTGKGRMDLWEPGIWLTNVSCSSCSSLELYASSLSERVALLRAYSRSTNRRLKLDPSEEYGVTSLLDGQKIYVVRCSVCMDTFFLGPAVEGLFRFAQEEG